MRKSRAQRDGKASPGAAACQHRPGTRFLHQSRSFSIERWGRYSLAKICKRVEWRSVPRDPLTAAILDDGERPEAVVLQFENPLRIVERERPPGKRHGLERHRRQNIKPVSENGSNTLWTNKRRRYMSKWTKVASECSGSWLQFW